MTGADALPLALIPRQITPAATADTGTQPASKAFSPFKSRNTCPFYGLKVDEHRYRRSQSGRLTGVREREEQPDGRSAAADSRGNE